jgi:hypothetical protein
MARYSSSKKRSSLKRRIFGIVFFLFIVFIVSIISFYFTNKDFATEVRQVRQAKPNQFSIGIDVSQTIRPDTLADFKDALILRLKNFTREKKVFYQISIFGLPGCGKESISDIVSTQSPRNPVLFSRGVEKRIRGIAIAGKIKGQEDEAPLTTPLFRFLDRILTKGTGRRVIIFTDLVNDEKGCEDRFPFPAKAVRRFGLNREGQIIFLYSTPYVAGKYDTHEKLMKEQKDFITKMKGLTSKGKVRVFFYHIPDDPYKRVRFLSSQLQKSIPATTIEIVWERISRMIDTIVGAVRG